MAKSPKDPERKTSPARAILPLAVLLTLLGTCGASQGMHELSDSPRAQVEPPDDLDEAGEAQLALNEALAEAVDSDPNRRALGAANILVSFLLIAASVLLTIRRASAVWWITQAALANIVYVVAQTISLGVHVAGAGEQLTSLIEASMAAQTGGPPPFAEASNSVLVLLGLGLAGTALARIGFLLFILWRCRRSDVRAALRP